jgi:DNA helicase HerA-like ATPase
VPVFLADVKGDVAGLAVAGSGDAKVAERAAQIGIADYAPAANPVVFWDLYGKLGHPVRTTVSEMGPTLLARILELNDTQSGVLDIVFKLADDRGLLLLDLEDLRALLGVVPTSARTSRPPTAWSARSRSARSSARCFDWNRMAPSNSSANPRSNLPT